jgi:hypothetical protein
VPKRRVIEAVEPRQSEAAELAAHKEPDPRPPMEEQPWDDPWAIDSLGHISDLCPRVEGDQTFLVNVQNSYKQDSLFSKVLRKMEHHKNFDVIDDLIYTHNLARDRVLCIPAIVHDKRRLTEIILTQSHQALGHLGPQKTSEYIRRHYWWPRIGQDVEQYC